MVQSLYLANEIVSLIMDHLDQFDYYACALINRSFHAVTTPLLWRTLIVRDEDTFTKVANGLAMTQYFVGQRVRTIDMKRKHRWTDSQLLQLIIHVPNLEYLYIRKGQLIHDKSMQQLPRHCPQLKTLLIYKSHLTQPSMDALGEHCRHLTQLTITACPLLEPKALSGLVGKCPLTQLSLGFNSLVEDDWMTSKETVKDMMTFTGLTHLTISGNSFAVIDYLLTKTRTAWHRLTHFKLDELHFICDDEIFKFLKSHAGIRHLALHGNGFSNRTLDAIWRTLPYLVHVDLAFNEIVCVHGLRRLIWHSPKLTHLSLIGCDFTPDDFPEADDNCLAIKNPLPGYPVFLSHLDQKALDEVRLGVNPGEHD